MRIPNKFNGYSADNIRLYNDPVTLGASALATMEGTAIAAPVLLGEFGAGAGALGSMMGGAELLGAAAANPLLAGIQAGTGLFQGGGVASLLNAPVTTALSPEIASNLAAANGLASTAPAQAAIEQAAIGTQAAQPTFQTLAQTQGNILNTIAPELPPPVPTVEQQLAEIYANPTDLSKFPQYENLAQNNGTQLVEKATTDSIVQPVENPFLNPANPTPGNSEFVEMVKPNPAGAPQKVLTEGGVNPSAVSKGSSMTGDTWSDTKKLLSKPNFTNIKDFASEHPYLTAGAGLLAYNALKPKPYKNPEKPEANIRPYDNSSYRVNPNVDYYRPYGGGSTAERNYFTGGLQALPIQRVAEGGLTRLAVGGPVETMSAENAVGQNMNYPQARLQTSLYSNPMVQRPMPENVIDQGVDTNVDPYTGEERMAGGGITRFGWGGLNVSSTAEPQKMNGEYKYNYNPENQQFTQLSAPQPVPQDFMEKAFNIGKGAISKIFQLQNPFQSAGYQYNYNPSNQQFVQTAGPGIQGLAAGGMSTLGGYSDGGRLLRGPGDGVSDSIPASIGNRQPARLADGEFVVPARIVSEIGNGSTEAGARKLYAMMDRVQGARKKSMGKGKVAVNSKADNLLPV